jgi:hypothetical protein
MKNLEGFIFDLHQFRNPGIIEDFWDQQGKVLQGGRSCCNYCSNKYVMAGWTVIKR